MLQYLDTLDHWIKFDSQPNSVIPEVSWQILRDLLHTDLFLRERPQDIAVSVIYFITHCYGVKIPYNEFSEINWWQVKEILINYLLK